MVTIVMPAYNEGDIIESSVTEWYDEVVRKLPGAEMVVVNDCSTDNTGEVLDRLAARLPGLHALRPPRNGGHGKALRFGFRHCTREYVFQTDSDRQHRPADFWRLWNARDDYDCVFGVRRTRADGTFRMLFSGTMKLVNYAMWGVWLRDANCPFKLMRRSRLEAILKAVPEDSFIPMVMIAILARRWRYRLLEVEVDHLPRLGGQQSLKGMLKWFRVARRCVWQLLQLRTSAAARGGA